MSQHVHHQVQQRKQQPMASTSYTSSSMISPRRKRKGPAPPPPVNRVTAYTSFPSIPGPSGVNVSPFTSPSSSGSSPSASQPATPLHSTSQGEPSTPSTSSSLLSPSSYPILAPSNSQSSSISSGPSTSTWQSHSTTQSMGRKKSIKTKPAPSPPPPLPPLPPIASASEMQRSSPTKPTVKTPTATNKNNDNGASSFVQKSSPRTPLSVNMIPTNCTSNRPSTCQPVIKCLPCRSHSVPVCPMVTLTRSLSDQKQINVKNMLKSVASYSSDLALPQSTVGLIASSRAIQQTLESDSIIITYDEPDYLYPIHHGLANCYSSCEIPYNISCNTNSPNYIGTNNGSNNLLMVCKEDAKVANNINCKMNDKGLRMRQKSQSFESTSLPTSPMHQKSITDRPPRPPRPSSIVNYKMINRSHPVIPIRTKRRSLVGSTCCTHGCRPDTLTLKERSGSLPLRPRSLPASPISKPYQGSSSTLPSPKSTSSTQSNLTFTRDKTLSGSFSGSTNQGNTGNINPSHTMCSIGCLTSCSLCSLSGLDGTTSTSTSNPTDQSAHLNYPSKDVHVNHDDDEDNCSNIYEEIDFTSISENVAALVSPRQLINPNAVNNVSRNHLQDESEKDKIANDLVNCDENNNGNNNVDNGNDMVITCNKEPNVVSIDSTRRLSSSSGPQANNSGGEILSDTSDDRVTVKSVNIKPWAYSTSSLDSEQSTTSSGSTVKQWNNQIIYSSHHHPCHPHHEQHHESQSPNYPHHHHHYDHNHSHHSDALSSPCFHGNYSDFYQGIDHPHPFHHPHSHHHHQAHHLYPYQMTNNHLLHASLDHCHHCPYHHHHHHHAPRQMITTSTSDHSLSSLSSNFSEDPATPTPPMMTLDDYTFHSSNFTFTPEDHYLVSPCCPEHLDEQDEDDVINDKKGSLKHSDDKEEEVNVAFKNEVKNGFGLIPCYPQPFYPIPDLVCDKETNEDENDDDDEDEEDNDDSVGKRFNKMTLKEDKGEQVKEDDEKGKEKKLLVNFKSSSVSSLKNSVKSSWPVKGKDAIPSLSSSPTSSSPSSAHQPAIFSPFVKPLKDNQLNNSVHNSNINCYCHQCFLPHCAKSTFNSTHHNLNHQRKDTFKESPSKMASSWDGSLSGAGGCSSGGGSGAGDDSNESSTHQYQSPNGSASINRLMQELQLAISFGQHRKAALLARQLALRKVSCTFNQSPNSTAIDDQPIIVYLYIEDKQSRQGPFPVQLYPSMTVKMLKLKIEGDFGFPVHFQSWILGKCLATNEDNCLSTYGITSSGCPIFLYLLSKSETKSETAQHDDDEDDDDDDGEKVDKNGNADEDEEEQECVDNGLKEIKGATEMVQQSIPIVGTLTGQNDDEKGKNELAGSLTSKSVNAAIKGPSNGPSDSTLLSSEPSTVNEKDIISVRKRSKGKVKPSLLLLSNSIATSTSTLTSPSTSTVQSTTMKPTTKIIKSTAHGENRDYRGNTGSRQMNNSTLPVGSLKKHHPKANLKADNGAMISTFDKQSVDSSKLKVKVDSRKASNINDKANQGNDEVDSGIGKDNDVNKESNDNQMVGQEKDESKGQIITTTYKELMALDDVDLVKNFEDFECPVCFINIPSGEGVVLRDCLHMFCRDCLSNAIEFCDEAIVKCPYRSDEYYCDSEITDREIKSLASPELYQKYLSRSMKAAELRIAKSFHCKTIDCPGWCEFDDNVNTFPCPVCGKVNCLTCQAIHEGINCRQYQDQLDDEAADQNEDAQKTKQFLDNMLDKGEALRCPICFVILIKKWGCDWVKCSMCQSEICWVTKGPRWGPGGKGDVSGGCKCMLNGQKCHPKCNYCH
ncbi:uncharacterized protein LOC107367038 [Tetranychus urticae]|uniref:uncharacterized protein LOC107367038 n=1 Tax=Tetranychus urticae TaxID=32264 RepID=UPI00077BC77E|nr:uncharacterized protein LOC107367038 [Tetranychus urticae]